jgi:hypothetical protein
LNEKRGRAGKEREKGRKRRKGGNKMWSLYVKLKGKLQNAT